MNEATAKRKYGPDIPLPVAEFLQTRIGGKGHRNPPIRSSAMSTMAECPRKFLLCERLGLKRRRYESALSRGTLYHLVRAGLFSGLDPSKAVELAEPSYLQSRSKVSAGAGKDGLLPDGKDASSVLRKMQEDWEVACAMALAFWELKPFDLSKFEPLHELTESLQTIQRGRGQQDFVCRFDGVLRNHETGDIWIVDDKTTSFSPATLSQSKVFACQPLLYREILRGRGLDPVGMVHSYLKVPAIRFCGKDATFQDYVARVKKWYVDGMSQSDPPAVQYWLRYDATTPSDFQERVDQTDRASRCMPRFDKFPRFDGACFKFNSACGYLPLCSTPESRWPELIEALYDVSFREDEEQEDTSQ